jgi:hypothetical protein
MSPANNSHKRKALADSAPADKHVKLESKRTSSSTAVLSHQQSDLHKELQFTSMSLQDIHDSIIELCRRVPVVPEFEVTDAVLNSSDDATTESKTPNTQHHNKRLDKTLLRNWAKTLQLIIDEFHLLIACLSPALYTWGTDRSGAADQHISLLSNEVVRAQDALQSRVTPRLHDVLAPVVALVADKTVSTCTTSSSSSTAAVDADVVVDTAETCTGTSTVTTDSNTSTSTPPPLTTTSPPPTTTTTTKQHSFISTYEDPDYVDLCFWTLARTAPLLRHVVLCHLDMLVRALLDYVKAQRTDRQHDVRGFVY